MHPKKEIERLNLRRRLNERLRFVKRRLVETMAEFNFVMGRCEKLPRGVSLPPTWAQESIKKYWETGVGKHFAKFTKEEIRENPAGALRFFESFLDSVRAYISHTPGAQDEPKEVTKAETDLKAFALKHLALSSTLKKVRKLKTRIDELKPAASGKEIVALETSSKEGREAIFDDDGEFVEGSTTSQIYYVVWFFWPEFTVQNSLTAKWLHQWLGDELGIYASLKLVERVHSQLKLAHRE